MSKVFISYAREDDLFTRQLYDRLRTVGEEPTWDQDHAVVPLTAPWRAAISEAIQGSDKFVFIISPDSLDSQPCQDELKQALKLHKQIIPVLRREPREGHSVPRVLEELNWVYFDRDATFDAAFGQLKEVLDTDLPWVKSHTRLLVRSTEWAEAGSDRSLLLRGTELRAAEEWLAQARSHPRTPPTSTQIEYIAAG